MKVIWEKISQVTGIESPTVKLATPIIHAVPPVISASPESELALLGGKWTGIFVEFCTELTEETFREFKEKLEHFVQEMIDITPKTPKREINHPNAAYHTKKNQPDFQARKATYQPSGPSGKYHSASGNSYSECKK